MTEETTSTTYGVEVRDDHPLAEWRFRCGWFHAEPEEGEEDGLSRAHRNLVLLLESGEYPQARVVRRVTESTVIEDVEAERRSTGYTDEVAQRALEDARLLGVGWRVTTVDPRSGDVTVRAVDPAEVVWTPR